MRTKFKLHFFACRGDHVRALLKVVRFYPEYLRSYEHSARYVYCFVEYLYDNTYGKRFPSIFNHYDISFRKKTLIILKN